MGAAGAPMPMYLSFIEPASTFNLNYTIGALGSAMIGGTVALARAGDRRCSLARCSRSSP